MPAAAYCSRSIAIVFMCLCYLVVKLAASTTLLSYCCLLGEVNEKEASNYSISLDPAPNAIIVTDPDSSYAPPSFGKLKFVEKLFILLSIFTSI